ncbi:MAG: SDR family oxidoreductase [Gammaproteobacteria bacterium]
MSQKAILITGVSSGIGRACLANLATQNYKIYATYRSPLTDSKLKTELEAHAELIKVDITKQEDVSNLLDQLRESLKGKGLYALINNAGAFVGGGAEYTSIEEYYQQLEVNFFGNLRMIQACLPLLYLQNNARIISISSILGRVSLPFLSPYTVSKHALEAFSDALRIELKPHGIRIALIEPGLVNTPLTQKMPHLDLSVLNTADKRIAKYSEQLEKYNSMAQKSLTRALQPEQVAQAVRLALAAEKPKTRYVIGMEGKLLMLFKRLLPDSWLDYLLLCR